MSIPAWGSTSSSSRMTWSFSPAPSTTCRWCWGFWQTGILSLPFHFASCWILFVNRFGKVTEEIFSKINESFLVKPLVWKTSKQIWEIVLDVFFNSINGVVLRKISCFRNDISLQEVGPLLDSGWVLGVFEGKGHFRVFGVAVQVDRLVESETRPFLSATRPPFSRPTFSPSFHEGPSFRRNCSPNLW